MADRLHLERLCRDLTDKGQLIEAGWVSLRLAAVPDDAPATQLLEMRNAFFAGAQHLFSSIMTVLEPDAEPTQADMDRLTRIDEELQRFIAEFAAGNAPTAGSA
ncbi:hypothetical protein VQ042_17930 [Aurantimonas sp. A2-1-M11]|uniref:hypothetical protein n=1 Tax=Aurantimonas sp. A2-1-M11 TaxID=3113712 RepID=UPI002F94171D